MQHHTNPISYDDIKLSLYRYIVNTDMLLQFSNLMILKIEECNIGENDIMNIICIVKKLHIEELSLISENFTINSSIYMKEMLEVNTTLKILDLSNSLNRSGTLYHIIKGIIRNNSITTLDLSSNVVYNSTFILLNEMLLSNNTLEILFIGDTIYDELMYGIDILWTNAMVYNTTLRKFSFSPHNILELDIIKIINNTIMVNKSLVGLHFKNLYIENTNNQYIGCIKNQLEYNYNKYNNTFWNLGIEKFHPDARKYIFLILLCNNRNYKKKYFYLCEDMWIYIFSFFQRKDF